MKIYKISQDVYNDYDTYSCAIVIAENEEEAKKIHPNGTYNYPEHTPNPDLEDKSEYEKADKDYGTWTRKIYVKVEYIGEAKKGSKKGVVVASFHAG
jgi:hypothetical protein